MQRLVDFSVLWKVPGAYSTVRNFAFFALITSTLFELVFLANEIVEPKRNTSQQLSEDHFRQKLKGVDPDLVKVVQRASEISVHGFWIVQGKRTQVEQNKLPEQGRTRPGPIVTWTRNSRHVEGRAIDVLPLDVEGRPTWDTRAFESVAKEFKDAATEVGVRIDWGYDLWKRDLGHIELSPTEDPKRASLSVLGTRAVVRTPIGVR